jgi:hypothetical protein
MGPVPREEPHSPSPLEGQRPFAVDLPLEQPAGIREALVGERGQHRLDPARPAAQRPSFATCSTVRPLRTDSGCVLTGLRRRSAASSSSLTSSQRSRLQPPIRRSV